MTSDGVAVLRHETEISDTTDVARHPELAHLRTVKVVDGREVSGWFCEDLTLAELKTLRAVERLPERRPRNTRWDGRFEIATFDELLMLLAEEGRRWDRPIGLHVELKSLPYLASLGLPVEDAVLGSLRDHGLDRRDSGVLLQSFEPSVLRRLRDRTHLPLVQLVDAIGAPADLAATGDPTTYDDLCSHDGLRSVAPTPTCWARIVAACWPAGAGRGRAPGRAAGAGLDGPRRRPRRTGAGRRRGPAAAGRGRRRAVQRPPRHQRDGPRRLGRPPRRPAAQRPAAAGPG